MFGWFLNRTGGLVASKNRIRAVSPNGETAPFVLRQTVREGAALKRRMVHIYGDAGEEKNTAAAP